MCVICGYVCVRHGGRQGAQGGSTYICMYIYTDQENEVLTTLHI